MAECGGLAEDFQGTFSDHFMTGLRVKNSHTVQHILQQEYMLSNFTGRFNKQRNMQRKELKVLKLILLKYSVELKQARKLEDALGRCI